MLPLLLSSLATFLFGCYAVYLSQKQEETKRELTREREELARKEAELAAIKTAQTAFTAALEAATADAEIDTALTAAIESALKSANTPKAVEAALINLFDILMDRYLELPAGKSAVNASDIIAGKVEVDQSVINLSYATVKIIYLMPIEIRSLLIDAMSARLKAIQEQGQQERLKAVLGMAFYIYAASLAENKRWQEAAQYYETAFSYNPDPAWSDHALVAKTMLRGGPVAAPIQQSEDALIKEFDRTLNEAEG